MRQATLHSSRRPVYTVSSLSARIRGLLTGDSQLQDIIVQGEVGDRKLSGAGHLYFSMKEDEVQINCVTFSAEKRLSFIPKTGDMIRVRGSIDTYAPRGSYQLRVESVERVGRGELWEEFQRLKEKLAGEGLFDSRHKKELPQFPERIGVVTSGSGAAFHDIRQVISEAKTPVVSAVGHETDFSISDMVADVRAATPSEAAELVVPDREKFIDLMDNLSLRMSLSVRSKAEESGQRLDLAEEGMNRAIKELLRRKREKLEHLNEVLEKSDPMAPLAKGFAMLKRGGEWVRNVADLQAGEDVSIVMAGGEAEAGIKKVKKDRGKEI